MEKRIENLVFEGGGVLGISYLGALHYLYKNDLLKNIVRVGGTSAGAITACILSFQLPFLQVKEIVDSLDYQQIIRGNDSERALKIPHALKQEMNKWVGDVDSVYRLLKNYGWYSTEYFYEWICDVINDQFDPLKKKPPYTFRDFKDSSIHKKNQPFYDLYIVGTDVSNKTSRVFSFETTPDLEVATAVRISMSVPLFFEAIHVDTLDVYQIPNTVFSDGGITWNYPIQLFDSKYFCDSLVDGVNPNTLGMRFAYSKTYSEIHNLLDYIAALMNTFSQFQALEIEGNVVNNQRSIIINTGNISPLDFNISKEDATYRNLYLRGYYAAKEYMEGLYGL